MTDWTFTWGFRNFIAELFMLPGILLVAILAVLFLTRRTKLKNSFIGPCPSAKVRHALLSTRLVVQKNKTK